MTLKVNRPMLLFGLLIWGGTHGFIVCTITALAVRDVKRGVPIGQWFWPSVVGVDLACLAIFLWGVWTHYCIATTVITDEYVSQPRLAGTFKIDWSQVKRITRYNNAIHLHSQQGKIVLAPDCYINGHEMRTKITEMVERYAIPFR